MRVESKTAKRWVELHPPTTQYPTEADACKTAEQVIDKATENADYAVVATKGGKFAAVIVAANAVVATSYCGCGLPVVSAGESFREPINEGEEDAPIFTVEGVQIKSQADLSKLSLVQLVSAYNEVTGRAIKSFPNKKTAAESLWSQLEKTMKAKANSKSKSKSKSKAKAKTAAAKPKGSFNPDAKITVLAKENPRREGTDAHEKFKLYKTGMTVADYIKKGGSSGKIRTDVARGNIKVG